MDQQKSWEELRLERAISAARSAILFRGVVLTLLAALCWTFEATASFWAGVVAAGIACAHFYGATRRDMLEDIAKEQLAEEDRGEY